MENYGKRKDYIKGKILVYSMQSWNIYKKNTKIYESQKNVKKRNIIVKKIKQEEEIAYGKGREHSHNFRF